MPCSPRTHEVVVSLGLQCHDIFPGLRRNVPILALLGFDQLFTRLCPCRSRWFVAIQVVLGNQQGLAQRLRNSHASSFDVWNGQGYAHCPAEILFFPTIASTQADASRLFGPSAYVSTPLLLYVVEHVVTGVTGKQPRATRLQVVTLPRSVPTPRWVMQPSSLALILLDRDCPKDFPPPRPQLLAQPSWIHLLPVP